jgi:hypothetical protein
VTAEENDDVVVDALKAIEIVERHTCALREALNGLRVVLIKLEPEGGKNG